MISIKTILEGLITRIVNTNYTNTSVCKQKHEARADILRQRLLQEKLLINKAIRVI